MGTKAALLLSVFAVAYLASVAPGQADGAPERICSPVFIPQVIEGGGMELIVGGESHLPTCRGAKRLVHLVPERLPTRRWRTIEGWKCWWSRLGGVECRRHDGTQISAYPGGD